MSSDVESWFNALSPEQREPLAVLRNLILSSSKDFKEELKWGRPVYSLTGLVCYLHKAAAHVTIGFQQGASLEDPDNLLVGDGKAMRHIKVGFGEISNVPAIRKLIDHAIRVDGAES